MIYILETKLPENKPVFIALTSIYGIGKQTSLILCKKLGFSQNLKVKDLNEEQTLEILNLIESLHIITNNELKQIKSRILNKLIFIKSYRGLRRVRGLPVRGQRTHTNAKSSRKNKKF